MPRRRNSSPNNNFYYLSESPRSNFNAVHRSPRSNFNAGRNFAKTKLNNHPFWGLKNLQTFEHRLSNNGGNTAWAHGALKVVRDRIRAVEKALAKWHQALQRATTRRRNAFRSVIAREYGAKRRKLG
jgi:hypothetical protein